MIAETCDTTSFEAAQAHQALARDAALTRLNKLITINTTQAQDQDAYKEHFVRLENEYHNHAKRYDQLGEDIRQTQQLRQHIKQIFTYRTKHPGLGYSDDAWNFLVDHVIVHDDGSIEFMLKDGTTTPAVNS